MARARTPLWIVVRSNTIVVKGNARAVLQAGGFKGIYVGTVRGLLLDRDRLPDLEAYLESRGVAYSVTEVGDAA